MFIILGLLGFAAFITLLIFMMPKGFKTTLNEIGEGKPALVFVYDPNRAISPSQFEQMNIARDALGDTAAFLSAQLATPQGDQFIETYQAKPAELFLFNRQGQAVERGYAPKSAEELIRWIQKTE